MYLLKKRIRRVSYPIESTLNCSVSWVNGEDSSLGLPVLSQIYSNGLYTHDIREHNIKIVPILKLSSLDGSFEAAAKKSPIMRIDCNQDTNYSRYFESNYSVYIQKEKEDNPGDTSNQTTCTSGWFVDNVIIEGRYLDEVPITRYFSGNVEGTSTPKCTVGTSSNWYTLQLNDNFPIGSHARMYFRGAIKDPRNGNIIEVESEYIDIGCYGALDNVANLVLMSSDTLEYNPLEDSLLELEILQNKKFTDEGFDESKVDYLGIEHIQFIKLGLKLGDSLLITKEDVAGKGYFIRVKEACKVSTDLMDQNNQLVPDSLLTQHWLKNPLIEAPTMESAIEKGIMIDVFKSLDHLGVIEIELWYKEDGHDAIKIPNASKYFSWREVAAPAFTVTFESPIKFETENIDINNKLLVNYHGDVMKNADKKLKFDLHFYYVSSALSNYYTDNNNKLGQISITNPDLSFTYNIRKLFEAKSNIDIYEYDYIDVNLETTINYGPYEP